MKDKFDELAKGLAGPSTRRQLLKKFGIGMAGVALACFGLANKAKADAGGCKGPGKECKTNADCCSGYCQFGFGKYKHPSHGNCL